MAASDINPQPSDEEAVAIMAAYEALWPKPTVAVEAPAVQPGPWRFSGRWWHKAARFR